MAEDGEAITREERGRILEGLGKLEIEVVSDPHDFWFLMDWLKDDSDAEEGLFHNRAQILEAFQHKCLYSLKAPQADPNCDLFARHDNEFVEYITPTPNLLPVLAVVNRVDAVLCVCSFLWVAPHVRGFGFAKKLVQQLAVTHTDQQTDTGKPFWEKMHIEDI